MAVSRCRLLVFSDLDGTLLDKQTYSWSAAADAIQALAERGMPLILSSSKTLSEIIEIGSSVGNVAPFIFENGAGAALPPGVFPALEGLIDRQGWRIKLFGGDRAKVLKALHRRRELGDRLEGFDDWTAQEVASVTGLDAESAARAKDRLATEPFLWHDTDEKWPAFAAALAQEGLTLVRGGRFWCAMGRFDKSDALRWLSALYREAEPDTEFLTVALGDSPNDIGMLKAADIPVVVNSFEADRMDVSGLPGLRRTSACGPSGWQEAITAILEEHAQQ
jgi:mannosyl-3-phosphoglycerate phosphatase